MIVERDRYSLGERHRERREATETERHTERKSQTDQRNRDREGTRETGRWLTETEI